MAQLLAGGAVAAGTVAAAVATAGSIFYFQPHAVIAKLIDAFPRVVWCLSASYPPFDLVEATATATATATTTTTTTTTPPPTNLPPPPGAPPPPTLLFHANNDFEDEYSEEANEYADNRLPQPPPSPSPLLRPSNGRAQARSLSRPTTPLPQGARSPPRPASVASFSTGANLLPHPNSGDPSATLPPSMAWTELQRIIGFASPKPRKRGHHRRRRRRSEPVHTSTPTRSAAAPLYSTPGSATPSDREDGGTGFGEGDAEYGWLARTQWFVSRVTASVQEAVSGGGVGGNGGPGRASHIPVADSGDAEIEMMERGLSPPPLGLTPPLPPRSPRSPALRVRGISDVGEDRPSFSDIGDADATEADDDDPDVESQVLTPIDEDWSAAADESPFRPGSRLPGISSRVISLTIDDAPSIYTSEILDILKEHGCHATFFIIGDHIEKHPDGHAILTRMVEEGHELGNHTWYDRPTIKLSPSVFEDELLRVDAIIDRYHAMCPNPPSEIPPSTDTDTANPTSHPSPPFPSTQPPSSPSISPQAPFPPPPAPPPPPLPLARQKWFRPGSGLFTPQMLSIAERHSYRTVLGCRFPVDTTSRDPALNSWHVCSGAHPGAVVVLHDCREHILETLRRMLPELVARQGWRVETISEAWRLARGLDDSGSSGSMARGGGGGGGGGQTYAPQPAAVPWWHHVRSGIGRTAAAAAALLPPSALSSASSSSLSSSPPSSSSSSAASSHPAAAAVALALASFGVVRRPSGAVAAGGVPKAVDEEGDEDDNDDGGGGGGEEGYGYGRGENDGGGGLEGGGRHGGGYQRVGGTGAADDVPELVEVSVVSVVVDEREEDGGGGDNPWRR